MISLQEDIVDMEDWVGISATLDILSLKNIQEERFNRQLEVQDRRLGEVRGGYTHSGIVSIRRHVWLWKSRQQCEEAICQSILYNIRCCFIITICNGPTKELGEKKGKEPEAFRGGKRLEENQVLVHGS